MKKVISGLLATLMTISMPIMSCANDTLQAEDIVDMKNRVIYDKIEEIGLAKARANQYASMYSDSSDDRVYVAMVNEIETLRDELTMLGADPSDELMDMFYSDMVSTTGVIEDVENYYGTYFDVWGISQTINASYGTYYCYDIVVQDYSGNYYLSTKLTQEGADGIEIFRANSSLGNAIANEIGSVAWDKAVGYLVCDVFNLAWIQGAYELVKSVVNVHDEIDIEEPVTMSGNSKSYDIFCDAVSTMHFIYVKNSTGDWTHTYTTNVASIAETHDWYMVLSQNGNAIPCNDEREYHYTLRAEDWAFRYTNAITAYRYDESIYTDFVDEFSVYACLEDGVEEVAVLSIACPEDPQDLIRYM